MIRLFERMDIQVDYTSKGKVQVPLQHSTFHLELTSLMAVLFHDERHEIGMEETGKILVIDGICLIFNLMPPNLCWHAPGTLKNFQNLGVSDV